jgi:isopentenyldiphosphate isomerase
MIRRLLASRTLPHIHSIHRIWIPAQSFQLQAMSSTNEEHFDVLDESGAPTGRTAPRSTVHREGLLHRAVHVWLLEPERGELLLQQRALVKDSWPGRWDISSAGHLSAGESSLPTAQRELEEELGISLPLGRFEFLFTHLERLRSEQRGQAFINNEFNDVYLVEATAEEYTAWQPGALTLQVSEVSAVRYFAWRDVFRMYETSDAAIVPCSDWESYRRVFGVVQQRVDAAAARKAHAAN